VSVSIKWEASYTEMVSRSSSETNFILKTWQYFIYFRAIWCSH